MTILEQIALAINQEIKRQWNATPAPGVEFDPNSWTAEGGTIDLEQLAKAAVRALIDTPWDLPHSSGAIESVCKETIRKYVMN